MKKHKILSVLLLTSALLTSCNDNTSSSNQTSAASSPSLSESQSSQAITNSNGNSDSSNSVISVSTNSNSSSADLSVKQKIYTKFINACTTHKYKVAYEYKSKQYEDVYTQNYEFYGTSNGGYMLLDSYKDSSKKMVYSYQYIDNKVSGLTSVASVDTTGQVVVFEDLSSGDPLYNFNALTFEEEELEEYTSNLSNTYKTTNKDVISALVYLKGISSYVSNNSITASTCVFYINENDDLEFILLDSNNSYIENSEGTLKDIGTASIKGIEDYISNFKMGETKLTSSQASSLLNENLQADSNVYYVEDGSKELIEKAVVKYSSSKLQNTLYDKDNNLISNNLYKKGDGSYPSLEEYGVNGLNEVATKATSSYWNDVAFVSKYFDLDAFRLESDGYYHYYGYQLNGLFNALTHLELKLNVSSLKIKIEDNTTKVEFESKVAVTSESKKINYKIESVISNDPVFIEQEVLDPIENQTDKIKTAINKLNGDNANFKATIVEKEGDDFNRTEVITVASNIVYSEANRTEDGKKTSYKHGYVQKDSDVIDFNVKEDDSLLAKEKYKSKKINEYTGWKAVGEVFKFNDDNSKLLLRDEVFEIDDYLLIGSYDDITIDESSLDISFNYTNLEISSMKFSYTITAGVTGTATVTFEYPTESNPIDFTSEFKEKVNNLNVDELPTSFNGESSAVVNAFKDAGFTTEEIEEIPYLPDEKFSKHFFGAYDWGILNIIVDSDYLTKIKDDGTAYMTQYKKDLVEKYGYTLVSTSSLGETYKNNKYEIICSKTLGGGFYFSKISN